MVALRKESPAVTDIQIDRCHRCIDMETMTPFYMVESEHYEENQQEYKVSAIRKDGKWHTVCSCPAGLKGIACKHLRWVEAAAAEYKDELVIAARCAASVAPAIEKPAPAIVSDVDAVTLARVLRRSAEQARKPVSKPAPLRPGTGFSLMR